MWSEVTTSLKASFRSSEQANGMDLSTVSLNTNKSFFFYAILTVGHQITQISCSTLLWKTELNCSKMPVYVTLRSCWHNLRCLSSPACLECFSLRASDHKVISSQTLRFNEMTRSIQGLRIHTFFKTKMFLCLFFLKIFLFWSGYPAPVLSAVQQTNIPAWLLTKPCRSSTCKRASSCLLLTFASSVSPVCVH